MQIHQLIMGHLPTDRDVVNYAKTCKSASDSVANIVWRERHSVIFDIPDGLNTDEIAREYKTMRGISRTICHFDELSLKGRVHISKKLIGEQKIYRPTCLAMLKQLIIGAFTYQIARPVLIKNRLKCSERT
jgi:hypothetical protein